MIFAGEGVLYIAGDVDSDYVLILRIDPDSEPVIVGRMETEEVCGLLLCKIWVLPKLISIL